MENLKTLARSSRVKGGCTYAATLNVNSLRVHKSRCKSDTAAFINLEVDRSKKFLVTLIQIWKNFIEMPCRRQASSILTTNLKLNLSTKQESCSRTYAPNCRAVCFLAEFW